MNHFHMNAIIKYMQRVGEATVGEIAALCEVTLPTARKYLSLMHAEKLLIFMRGKAERMPQNYATVLGWRSWESKEEKRAIGKVAASFVKDGETIFIGGGSTVLCMLEHLENRKNLTVITNSVYVINKLLLMPHIRMLCTGGGWNPETNTFAGDIPSVFKGLSPHLAFFGTVAINVEQGIMQRMPVSNQDELLMAQRSKSSYILADHSKFDAFEPWVALPAPEIKNIITDRVLTPLELRQWKQNGTNIITVDVSKEGL